jgi:hypothetical protein
MMSMHDAAALEKMLQEGFCEDENRTNSTDNRDGATLITAITDAQQCVAPTVPLARELDEPNIARSYLKPHDIFIPGEKGKHIYIVTSLLKLNLFIHGRERKLQRQRQ